jgi:hypothetical protein
MPTPTRYSRAIAITALAGIVGLTTGLAAIPTSAQADTAPSAAECLALVPANITAVTAGDVLAAFGCAERLDESLYTTSSWANFTANHWATAIEAYEQLEFITSAGLLMQLGFHALELRGDTADLASLVAALPSDSTGYPPQAWATYAGHLAVARSLVIDSSDATQTQIDQVAGRLAAAAQALGVTVSSPGTQDPPAGSGDQSGKTDSTPDPQPAVTVTATVTVPGPTVTVQPLPLTEPQQPQAATARIKAAQTTVVLRRGSSIAIPAGAYAPGGARAKVTFTSAKKSVATVSAAGKITAKNVGRTTIKLASPGASTVTIAVKVVARTARAAKVTKVSATGIPRTMTAGQIAYAAGRYSPAGAVKAKVTYTSSDKAVATVDNTGRILAGTPGTATITVKAGAKTRKVALTVRPATGG